jgi:heme/copper-type cytochrome/quinol oxidase subunit 2
MRAFALLADPIQNLSIFDPASPLAEAIRSLFILVLAVTGGIFLVTQGVLLYSIVRFRNRPPTGIDVGLT